MHPEKHLQEGLPIEIVNDDNCIKYCKQWSRSGDRYFIYGMKDIYSSFGGRDVVNRHLNFSWDGNILHLSLGDMMIPREITEDRTEMGKGSVLVKIIDRKTFHKVWEEWELPPVMPSMYILLNKMDNHSDFYIGYSLNMYQRLSTHNSRPPLEWNKALLFFHNDNSMLYVEEAMRLEYLALERVFQLRGENKRRKNRKGAIDLNYSKQTVEETVKMFRDIMRIVDDDLKLNIFS